MFVFVSVIILTERIKHSRTLRNKFPSTRAGGIQTPSVERASHTQAGSFFQKSEEERGEEKTFPNYLTHSIIQIKDNAWLSLLLSCHKISVSNVSLSDCLPAVISILGSTTKWLQNPFRTGGVYVEGLNYLYIFNLNPWSNEGSASYLQLGQSSCCEQGN